MAIMYIQSGSGISLQLEREERASRRAQLARVKKDAFVSRCLGQIDCIACGNPWQPLHVCTHTSTGSPRSWTWRWPA